MLNVKFILSNTKWPNNEMKKAHVATLLLVVKNEAVIDKMMRFTDYLGSISSTFYVQLLRSQLPKA